MDIKSKAKAYLPDTIAIRRHLHQHPELSGNEVQTSSMVRDLLSQWHIPFERIQGNGVIGTIDSGKPGKTVALRADMDALPIREESEKEYCSQNEGVGHLCGHDCHTASLLTAARILNEEKESFTGRVRLIFQPSEEAPGVGAGEMIANGAMEGVDAIFGVHMYNSIDVGSVSVQPGPRMAASLKAFIEIKGVGGHGGAPHQCVDPIVAASAVVMNLQTISSRELNMLDSAVITVGTFHGGTQFSAVADVVNLGLTIKFFNAALTDKLRESITRIVENTVAAFRATCSIQIEGFLQPVVNDGQLSAIATASAAQLLDENNVIACPPWSAAEDFGKYLDYAPGVFAFIGGRQESKGFIHPAHHPSFDVDEQSLEVASGLYAQFSVNYLNQTANQ